MKTIPVSILMACYNAERFLRESICSILNQTFQDFELIVVDDGSTDGTYCLINEYAKSDSRIRILVKEHTGLSDSLQYGLKLAQGEWIARWDADDFADSKRLEKQLNYIQKYQNLLLIGSGCVEVDEKGKFIKKHKYPEDHQTLVRNLEKFKKFFPHSSAFFSRKKAIFVGGYRSRFMYAQDRDLWFRLIEVGRIACVPEPLIYLRKHSKSISHEHYSKQLLLGIAAAVCHIERVQQFPDPSCMEESIWLEFLHWLEHQLEPEILFSDKKMWMVFRGLFYNGNIKSIQSQMKALIKALKHYPRLIRILFRRWRGSNLVFRLAQEWQDFFSNTYR